MKASSKLKVHLAVERRLGKLWARLEFVNLLTEGNAYLVGYNLPSFKNQLKNDVFQFVPADAVKYIGTLSKRREVTLAHCIRLKPGETLSCEAELDEAYAIPAFKKIKVQYAAMHVDPLESPGLEYLTSNTVEIDT